MLDELKKILLAHLSKAFNLDEKEVAALLFNADGTELLPEALDNLTKKQVELVGKLKGDSTTKFNDGYKKAKGEVLTAFEKELREKFEVDSDLQGLELIEALVKQVEAKSGDGNKVTEEALKKSPIYQELLSKFTKLEKGIPKLIEEAEGKVKTEWKKEKTLSVVRAKALDIVNSRNPIALTNDAEKAKIQRGRQDRLFMDELLGYEFDIREDGGKQRIVVMKDGKVLEDSLGHEVEFDALVTEKSDTYYDFQASSERSSTGGGAGGGSGAGGAQPKKFTLTKPSNQAEFARQYEAIEKDETLKPDEKLKLHQDLVKLNKGEKVEA